MHNGIWMPPPRVSKNLCANSSGSRFGLVLISLSLLLIGCASPSEPVERKPPVPSAITDLSVVQSANEVVLTFTMPTETVDRRPLKDSPAIEIYRGLGDGKADSEKHLTLEATIPSAAVDRYVAQGRARYLDQLKPDDFGGREAVGATYSVRTRASEKKDSDASNAAYLLARPALDPIADLRTQVTHPAVVLAWSAPQKTMTGSTPPVASYRIYRAEGETSASTSAQKAKPTPAFVKIGEGESTTFQDTHFEFGKSYVYSVRSVVASGVETLESADSNIALVTPKDVFPPAAPLGIVVALVPEQGQIAAHLELSWAVSPETDIAGYNVYRSEQADTSGTRLNTDLLLTPAFRDMNVQPGHRYFYTATAVDRSGNESAPSEAVSGGVPAESQPNP